MKNLTSILTYNVILASGSPRRKELLSALGLDFKVQKTDVEETYPSNLEGKDIALYLATLKADSFNEVQSNELIITADTIVCLEKEVLNKPADYDEAVEMLTKLSGKQHNVITGVCIKTSEQQRTFHVSTSVYFKELTAAEITHYVTTYQPYDKAGGYGIQEWIGLIGIEKIEGSYFNVVGLPVHEVYEALKDF